jgi:hypothetical protein
MNVIAPDCAHPRGYKVFGGPSWLLSPSTTSCLPGASLFFGSWQKRRRPPGWGLMTSWPGASKSTSAEPPEGETIAPAWLLP